MLRRPAKLLMTLVALLIPMASGAPAAMAGSFDVHACDSSWPSSANNSFVPVADAGMTAYSDCQSGAGITARNVYDGGTTAAYAGAYMIFDAPPGTSVSSVDFDAGYQRADCSYNVAMVVSGPDLAGHDVWGNSPGQACGGFETPGDTAYFPTRFSEPVGTTRLRIESRCGAVTCSRNGVSAIRVRNVIVHVADDTQPAIGNARGTLMTSDAWLSGTQAAGFDASDGAGIAETSIQVDGKRVAGNANPCDYTLRAPCPGGSETEQLSTAGFGGDGDHTVTATATDAGRNTVTVSHVVHIDNSPPDAPLELTLDGGDGWHKANSFDVHWKVPPANGAGVAGALWQICPAGSDKDCTTGATDGADIAKLTGLAVPRAGAWTLRVWLKDQAGNQDSRLAAAPVTLRYDETSPNVSLNPLSADDPTRIVAPTSDEGAGVTGGQIAIRKVGTTDWEPLATTVETDDLTARIDDEHLSDGSYELQARATDGAGNERVTSTFAGGQPAQVTLPLRLKTVLTAGVARRSRGKVKLVKAAYASFGRLVQVRGRLSTPEGNAMAGTAIQAFTQVRDGTSPPLLVATAKTSKTGHFSFLVKPGPSRTIRIRYDGAAQVRGATQRVVLYVRSATTIRPSRKVLVNGEAVRFSGRIATGRIPVKGKLIELEVLTRGRWRTFATTRATRRGLWKYDYRFDGTRGVQDYRFRAKVPRETGYPFAAGGSKIVRVRVRGI